MTLEQAVCDLFQLRILQRELLKAGIVIHEDALKAVLGIRRLA